ncbi:MAG TPA: hypothetical protein VLL52_07990 [Anaerolineae bacterium]|nr:hypothetical protein [Anaerolineae bacterium]
MDVIGIEQERWQLKPLLVGGMSGIIFAMFFFWSGYTLLRRGVVWWGGLVMAVSVVFLLLAILDRWSKWHYLVVGDKGFMVRRGIFPASSYRWRQVADGFKVVSLPDSKVSVVAFDYQLSEAASESSLFAQKRMKEDIGYTNGLMAEVVGMEAEGVAARLNGYWVEYGGVGSG